MGTLDRHHFIGRISYVTLIEAAVKRRRSFDRKIIEVSKSKCMIIVYIESRERDEKNNGQNQSLVMNFKSSPFGTKYSILPT